MLKVVTLSSVLGYMAQWKKDLVAVTNKTKLRDSCAGATIDIEVIQRQNVAAASIYRGCAFLLLSTIAIIYRNMECNERDQEIERL